MNAHLLPQHDLQQKKVQDSSDLTVSRFRRDAKDSIFSQQLLLHAVRVGHAGCIRNSCRVSAFLGLLTGVAGSSALRSPCGCSKPSFLMLAQGQSGHLQPTSISLKGIVVS